MKKIIWSLLSIMAVVGLYAKETPRLSKQKDGLIVLSRTLPTVKWETDSILTADVTCDGIKDNIYLGKTNGERPVVIAAISGSDLTMSTITFRSASNYHDSVGGVDGRFVQMNEESLDYDLMDSLGQNPEGFERSKKCSGIDLSDKSEKDTIHLYWNHKQKQLGWWRN